MDSAGDLALSRGWETAISEGRRATAPANVPAVPMTESCRKGTPGETR